MLQSGTAREDNFLAGQGERLARAARSAGYITNRSRFGDFCFPPLASRPSIPMIAPQTILRPVGPVPFSHGRTRRVHRHFLGAPSTMENLA